MCLRDDWAPVWKLDIAVVAGEKHPSRRAGIEPWIIAGWQYSADHAARPALA